MALLLENPRRRRRARRSSRRRKTSARRRRSNPARRTTKRRRSSKRRSGIVGKIGGAGVQSLLMKAAATAATFWAASFTTRALTNKFPGLNAYQPHTLQIGAGVALVFARSYLPAAARRYATPVGIGLAASGILSYLMGTGANPEQVADNVLPSKIAGMYGPPVPPGFRSQVRASARGPRTLAGDEMLGLGADAMLFGGPELLGLGYDDPAEDLDGLGYTSFGGRA